MSINCQANQNFATSSSSRNKKGGCYSRYPSPAPPSPHSLHTHLSLLTPAMPGVDLGRGCRGYTTPPLEMTCGFLKQLVFCKKKSVMPFLTGAHPPKKNHGSSPACSLTKQHCDPSSNLRSYPPSLHLIAGKEGMIHFLFGSHVQKLESGFFSDWSDSLCSDWLSCFYETSGQKLVRRKQLMPDQEMRTANFLLLLLRLLKTLFTYPLRMSRQNVSEGLLAWKKMPFSRTYNGIWQKCNHNPMCSQLNIC